MYRKVIKTESQYKKAIKRTLEIFHTTKGNSEAGELELLLVLVKDYEDKHISIPELDPIEERGLKAKDLEPLIGSKGHVSSHSFRP